MRDMLYGCWPRIMAAAWRIMERLQGKCVDECVSFGNVLALQIIICFRLSLHFSKLITIRAIQDPVRLHDCENPLN